MIMMIAAQNNCISLFKDCLQRGGDLFQILTITVKCTDENDQDMYGDEVTSQHSALHYLFYFHNFNLQQLEWPEGHPDVLSFKDYHQNTLLHLSALGLESVDVDNVRFLMKHGADVNIPGPSELTVIQQLLRRYPTPRTMDILLHVVDNACTIERQNWKSNVSVLHVLCVYGKYQLLPLFVKRGANIYDLSCGRTLIDTLVLSLQVPLDVKEKTLAILLDSPFNLGPYHAHIVAKRSPERKKEIIPYVIEFLLLPALITTCVKQSHCRMVKMLVDSGAVSDTELLAVKPLLPRAAQEGNEEAVQYLRLLTDALKPSPSLPTSVIEALKLVDSD
ncbi:hypothetical protein ACOMHN_016371 [Nucella lapillus]